MLEKLSPEGRGGLVARPPLPESLLELGSPKITGYTYHDGRETGVKCVVWGATPYRIHPKQRPDFEFSLLLSGSVTLTDGAGNNAVVAAGDAFVLPPGFTYQWRQDEPVLKYALSYTPANTTTAGLVFTPMRSETLATKSPGLLFGEQNDTFRVELLELSGDTGTLTLSHGQGLATVVSGDVTLRSADGNSAKLSAGEAVFFDAEARVTASAPGPARLLVCTVRNLTDH